MADEPPRSDVLDGHAREATEHEVASSPPPGQSTGPPKQAGLQGEPTTGHRSAEVVGPPSDCADTIAGSDWLRWYYVCARCGYTSSSTRHDLTACTATFPIQPEWMTPPALPCGGELGDPYTYRWMLTEAGLIEEVDG